MEIDFRAAWMPLRDGWMLLMRNGREGMGVDTGKETYDDNDYCKRLLFCVCYSIALAYLFTWMISGRHLMEETKSNEETYFVFA